MLRPRLNRHTHQTAHPERVANRYPLGFNILYVHICKMLMLNRVPVELLITGGQACMKVLIEFGVLWVQINLDQLVIPFPHSLDIHR